MGSTKPYNVKKIAVIGAGPCGLATAKYLLAERSFSQIDIFEQRNTVGGVWNFSPETPLHVKLPQTSPCVPVEDPQRREDGELIFPSPMYEGLHTNIPHELMGFSDLPLTGELFPPREAVREYVEEYANDIRHLIHFSTQVLDVRPLDSHGPIENSCHEVWRVKTRKLGTRLDEVRDYDAVAVASGHYDVPYVPDIVGLTAWNEHYPGVVTHSKSYRRPDSFKGKKVIVVGNSASGLDIASQVATVCSRPVLISQRSPSYQLLPGAQKEVWEEELPEISAFLPPSEGNRAVRFANNHVETEIDAVVFCTGYLYSFPFLSSLKPSPQTPNGMRAQHVYQHIFYTPRPTLAFIVLPQRVIPFQVAESQSAVIARVWSNRMSLPSQAKMDLWEVGELARKGAQRSFHTMGFPLDVDYINELHAWCLRAEPKPEGEKLPPLWGPRERWIRGSFKTIRKALSEKGGAKHQVKSLRELGFDFEKLEEKGMQSITQHKELDGNAADP